MKNWQKFLLVGLLGMLATSEAMGKVTLWTCGDSSMCNYPTDGSTDKRGWCQFINTFFDSEVRVINNAKGGLELHKYMDDERYFQYVMSNLNPGDYVLLQFAHNEYKNQGMDGYELRDYYLSVGDTQAAESVALRGSVPNGSYIRMLEEVATRIREAGGNPIFATSIARVKFDGNDVSRYGRHDLGGSFSVITPEGIKTRQSLPADDHSMDYTWQMKRLAEKLDIPCIDLMEATRRLYLSTGSEQACLELFTAPSDWSHPNYDAAWTIGRMGALLLKDKGILSDHIIADGNDLRFLQSAIDLGEQYVGNNLKADCSFISFSHGLEGCDVTLSVSDGFEISVDNATWNRAVVIPDSGDVSARKVRVRVMLEKPGSFAGTLRAESNGHIAKIPLTACGLELPSADTLLEPSDSTSKLLKIIDFSGRELSHPIAAQCIIIERTPSGRTVARKVIAR